jgi:hypothetical protein
MAWDSELFCKDSFDNYLKSRLGVANTGWQRVSEDPPDFYLALGNRSFAVEVTQTEVMQDTALGTGQVRKQTYLSTHAELVEEVEQAAKASGMLNGTYAILFRSPLTASRFSRVKKDVLKKLLDYVQQTQQMTSSPSQTVLHEDLPVCWIEKLHSQSSKVCEVFQGFAWVESPEITDEVCQMLQHAVDDKKSKFERKGESLPKILLLLNTYDFASPSMYKNCIHRINNADFFHSIFVVWHDGSGFIVYTCDKNWSKLL